MIKKQREGSFVLMVFGLMILVVLLICLFVLRQNYLAQASSHRRNYDIGHAMSIMVKSGETADFHISFWLKPNDRLYASVVNGRYDQELESSVEETLSNATMDQITADHVSIEQSIQDSLNKRLGSQVISDVSITRTLVWIG